MNIQLNDKYFLWIDGDNKYIGRGASAYEPHYGIRWVDLGLLINGKVDSWIWGYEEWLLYKNEYIQAYEIALKYCNLL